MKAKYLLTVGLLFVLWAIPSVAHAQASPEVFVLPEAHAGEKYQVAIEDVLRRDYQLKLATASNGSVIQWTLADGRLPQGLTARADGVLTGSPAGFSAGTYQFRLSVSDTTSPDDRLTISFSMQLTAPRLRLVKVSGPRLVPADDPSEEVDAKNPPPTRGGATPQSNQNDVLTLKTPVLKKDANGGTLPIDPYSEGSLSTSVEIGRKDLKICRLMVVSRGPGNRIIDNKMVTVDRNKPAIDFKIKLGKGINEISIVPYQKVGDEVCDAKDTADSLSVMDDDGLDFTVKCNGGDCGKDTETAKKEDDAANYTGRNMRAILGIEQTAAASTESESRPFLDFFFRTPLPFGRNAADDKSGRAARLSSWGDIRLISTPQQVGALSDVVTSGVTSITAAKTNKLTMGFDFVAGADLRIKKAGRTDISLIAAFGAITPLTPRESAQIFQTPDQVNSPQAARFYARYPGAAGKQYIAFVSPDRDRFLRQYFGGIRFKTYREDSSFPGMVDVTFGQNESVTGGRLSKLVVGIDGFYTLPLPNGLKSLFLFGSARFKALQRKLPTTTPFILDTAPSSVSPTDNSVFIADPTPSNRDYYRIGVGVDLFQLFNKKKEEPKPNQ